MFFKVVQMVSLMDRLLKLENLDLHLTPYRVLATGQDEGMLEFIPSSSLAQVVYPWKKSFFFEISVFNAHLNDYICFTRQSTQQLANLLIQLGY